MFLYPEIKSKAAPPTSTPTITNTASALDTPTINTIAPVPTIINTSTSIPTTSIPVYSPSPTSSPSKTPTATASATLALPSSEQVYFYSGTLHLGDESFSTWKPLSGSCYEMSYTVRLPANTMNISFQAFDTDTENPIIVNGVLVAYIPAQNIDFSGSWTDTIWVQIPINVIQQGTNILQICSQLVPNPDFPGDLDDFQIRNIVITVER